MATIRPIILLPLIGLLACDQQAPGHYFAITLETSLNADGELKDECNEAPASALEEYEYRLDVDGANVQIFLDDVFLASGALGGQDLSYQSPIWTENRGENEVNVRWAVRGDADIAFGGDEGAWVGEERIDIVTSSDPDVPAGCAYWFDATGRYLGEVE